MTARTERLFSGYGGRMLVTLSVAWATLQLGRFLLPPLLPSIIADLGTTTVVAGLALGTLQAVYAVTQFPSGRLSDRFTRPSLVVPGLVVLTAGFLVVSGTTTVWLFVAAALLLGVGKGLFAVPSRAQLSDLFVRRRGQALGLYAAGTDVGGILASVGGVVVTGGGATMAVVGLEPVPGLDWRTPFVPVAAVLGLVCLAYVAWNRDSYRIGRTNVELLATIRRLATTRRQREALVAFALFYFVVGAWVNFLPTYLTNGKGFAEPVAAGLYAVVFVVGVVVKPTAGALSDRVPRRAVGAGGLLLGVVALAAVVTTDSLIAVGLAIAAYALGYKAVFPVADATLLDAAPADNLGADLGAARALFLGVGALGPVYMGWIAAVASYRLAFTGLAGCLVVAAALLLRGVVGSKPA
ncbi:MFS transporter [Haloarcula halophila]|uniref:MFS transporter n=1 Tax=Haloarcula TaxID=2237 RepID=UPI0023E473E3|nr:MFS transporter [Halomicroarcula sp. DFY41]